MIVDISVSQQSSGMCVLIDSGLLAARYYAEGQHALISEMLIVPIIVMKYCIV